MPKKLRRAGVCPGPGYDKPCTSGRKGTPRGGRCKDCRKEAMRYWHRLHHHGSPDLIGRSRPARDHRDNRRNSSYAKCLAEEIAAARAVKAEAVGVKGGLRIVNDWLKQP
jgi:hypothetical protein